MLQVKEINNINANQIINDKTCWIRMIEVTLTSRITNQKLVFNNFDPKHQFNIDINGVKEVATNKDNGTLTITNLEYDTLMQIVLCEFYDIEIKVGYKSAGNLQTVVKAEVSFITQKIHSKHDVDTYITFASPMVAKFSQSRLNFSLNSGINIYGALNYICQLSGIGKNANIDQTLKLNFLKNVYQNYNTAATVFDDINKISGNYMISVDGSEDGSVINILNIANTKRIKVDPNHMNISKGNPTVSSDGLKISLLPTRNYCPGEVLVIDNGLLDVSIQNASSVTSTFNTNYLDQNGQYMIIRVDYHFQNRGPAFEYNIQARALDIIKKMQISGGNS